MPLPMPMPMAPPRLAPGRWGRRQAELRDRVAGARGRHVVRIKINMRRTRWKSRRMDVSASAWRAANTSPRAVLSSRLRLPSFLFVFFFASRGFFLPPRFWVLHVQYHASRQGTRGKRAHKRNFCFFFGPPHPFLHDEPTQPNPSHHLYLHIPIASCFPQSAVVKHISL